MVRKHGFLPVPSYGLREAHSPNLVEGKFSELRMYGVLRSSAMHLGVELAPRWFRLGGLAGARAYASGRNEVPARSSGGMGRQSVP
jgi:hypothetical protein